jgi:23S rRNA pseudouridine1911/1915/1917 synthase
VPQPLQILYEDNHLLAVVKPAGIATMGVAADVPSLLALARDYIKRKYQKPGNVYLGTVSRLDAPVSGVVLFARTSKAAARLSEQFRERTVEKAYWALVEGRPPPNAEWTDWLAEDDRHRKMHVVAAGAAGAKEARLAYRLLRALPGEPASHLEVSLETGRKHQIRVQLAAHGYPVLGDRKYGARSPFPHGIGLHARRLAVAHPIGGERLELIAPPPASWRSRGIDDAY